MSTAQPVTPAEQTAKIISDGEAIWSYGTPPEQSFHFRRVLLELKRVNELYIQLQEATQCK